MTLSPVSAHRRGRAGRSAQVGQSGGPARSAGRIFGFGKQCLYQRELGPWARGANTELAPFWGLLCGLGLASSHMPRSRLPGLAIYFKGETSHFMH